MGRTAHRTPTIGEDMMRRKYLAIATVLALGLGAVVAWAVVPGARAPVQAADHNDPPGRVTGASADRAADIGDVYAFTRGENTVFVLTFAGPQMPVDGQSGTYDRDVIYQLWVDADGAGTGAEATPITVRFGQNTSGHWGMEVAGFPGQAGAVMGPVELQNALGGGAAGTFWAGLRDDPFFFDGTGFDETRMTGELSFDSTRDSFAGQNITAIVLSVPNTELASSFDTWATASRISG